MISTWVGNMKIIRIGLVKMLLERIMKDEQLYYKMSRDMGPALLLRAVIEGRKYVICVDLFDEKVVICEKPKDLEDAYYCPNCGYGPAHVDFINTNGEYVTDYKKFFNFEEEDADIHLYYTPYELKESEEG